MDIQNHYYGHSAALAHHCGLTRLRHISGLLQHGWTVSNPILAQFGDFSDRGANRRRLAWTSSSRAWSVEEPISYSSKGEPLIDAIGAPYLYLLDAIRAAGKLPERTERSLVLPLHGTALLKVNGDHRAYAELVRQREGQAMVSLHVEDLQNPEIAGAWQEAGHTIVSAGERRDPYFLGRIVWMMTTSKRVISNRLSTSSLYAAISGAEVETYGPEFQLGSNAEVDPGAVMRDLWPEFYQESPDQAALREIAAAELGVADQRSAEELKRILGWDGSTMSPFFEYWLSGPVSKAQAVLGIKKRPEGAHATEAGRSPLHWLRHPLKHLPSPLPALPPLAPIEPLSI
ncbi:hypothetical protein [Psychromicrobium lacuslunae]|uniref:Uncharacterized protein n=1 Tax=Psychromicrobium lacuslunae TaxID=1618207 RepID=A0A0D4BZ70_9MICC|nr:hypothetical protein [Psychromicrobium lacuslunae]AJT41416.1 hypothetical protein UM93_07620 [Psychromicrobium lacuslunae]